MKQSSEENSMNDDVNPKNEGNNNSESVDDEENCLQCDHDLLRQDIHIYVQSIKLSS